MPESAQRPLTTLITPSGASLVPAAFTATATGNIDRDGDIDQWHVNNIKLDLDLSDVSDL